MLNLLSENSSKVIARAKRNANKVIRNTNLTYKSSKNILRVPYYALRVTWRKGAEITTGIVGSKIL
jgi:hypothetical protein